VKKLVALPPPDGVFVTEAALPTELPLRVKAPF